MSNNAHRFLLYPVSQWEQNKIDNAYYERVVFTKKSHQVRKVEGLIFWQKVIQSTDSTDYRKQMREVWWDGFGRCWSRKHNTRLKRYDIPLKQED